MNARAIAMWLSFAAIPWICAGQAPDAAAPQTATGWLNLARSQAKQGNREAAFAAARRAEALGAEDPAILQGLANFYATAGADQAKAAALGYRYAELKPEDRTAWRRLAQFCLSTGQPERAIAAAKNGFKNDPSAELHGILGTAYAQIKDWKQAETELTEARRLAPYDEAAHFQLAQLYLLQQDFVSAVRVLEEARKTFDKSAQIELALGVAWYGQREFPKAVDQFLKTIRLAPEVPQPYAFLGRILEHAGDRLPEIAARFQEYEAAHPLDPLGHVLHAKAILAQLPPAGFPAEAEAALRLLQDALKLEEADAEAHLLAGTLLERKGDFAAAATHLERSIALNGKDPAPHYRLARVYARLGRPEDSRRERELHEKLSDEENPFDRGIQPGRSPAPPRAK